MTDFRFTEKDVLSILSAADWVDEIGANVSVQTLGQMAVVELTQTFDPEDYPSSITMRPPIVERFRVTVERVEDVELRDTVTPGSEGY